MFHNFSTFPGPLGSQAGSSSCSGSYFKKEKLWLKKVKGFSGTCCRIVENNRYFQEMQTSTNVAAYSKDRHYGDFCNYDKQNIKSPHIEGISNVFWI